MKSFCIILFVWLGYSAFVNAQLSDQNSEVIQQYFENISSNPASVSTNQATLGAKSLVQIKQVGDLNSVFINSLQVGDNQLVNQTGYKNSYEYYCSYSVENINLTINQEGTLNSLKVYGENSLMKNAVIQQKSNFQELVIRNSSQHF